MIQAKLGVRHTDLRPKATAVIAKAASALLCDTAVWYLVWVCGRVCISRLGERCDELKKTGVKFFV